MKPITFTHHAPIKIAERRLRLQWVEQVARSPEWREPDPDDESVERLYGTIAEFGDRILRLAVRETLDEICVITANFDRGARRRRARKQL